MVPLETRSRGRLFVIFFGSLTVVEVAAVIGIIGTAVGAIATVYKLRPDRDVLMITQAQGASTILNDLVDTLREEVAREREKANYLEKRNKELEKELQGLRRRAGTRHTDG